MKGFLEPGPCLPRNVTSTAHSCRILAYQLLQLDKKGFKEREKGQAKRKEIHLTYTDRKKRAFIKKKTVQPIKVSPSVSRSQKLK